MSVVIGIDLGTTTSAVACLKNGVPYIIRDMDGERFLPSVVGVGGDGRLVIGKAAKRQLVLQPERTVQEVKRLMGTNQTIRLGSQDFLPQEIAAVLLRQLKETAEDHLGEKVTEAVVTVPAMFDNLQRQATKEAAAIAGLKVDRIINEPTAAALAYGLGNLDQEAKILVYDLGGGTFDVTILEMYEGILDVKASRGDTRLGGKDFDERLMKVILDDYVQVHGIDLRKNASAMLAVKEASERTKIELTEKETATFLVSEFSGAMDESGKLPGISEAFGSSDAIGMNGQLPGIRKVVSRGAFEMMIDDLLDRADQLVGLALKQSGLTAGQIDVAIAVGGSSRIPCVRGRLERMFPGRVRIDSEPEQAVVLGAAIQAGIKDGQFSGKHEILLTDVCPFSLGVSVTKVINGEYVSGVSDVLIPINATIPSSREKTYFPAKDWQTKASIEVYQGEARLVRDNLKIGEFEVVGIPPARVGVESLNVRFSYDLNGILKVETEIVSIGCSRVELINLRTMNPGQISSSRESLGAIWPWTDGDASS